MKNSFIKIALRHLWLNKLYTSINISGLAIGMGCSLLAILYVQHELSYDRFHTNASQIFRITTSVTNPQNGSVHVSGATGQVQGPAFKDAIPEIEEYTRVYQGGDVYNLISDKKALAVQALYVDESFFRVFSFPLLYGNASHALDDLRSIVITEKTAIRFFGKTNVIGNVLKLEEGHGIENFIITGVAKEAPENSSIKFEAVMPFKYMQTMFDDKEWLNFYLSTFVSLKPGADVQKVKEKFAVVFKDNAAGQLLEQDAKASDYKFGLQPLSQLHLNIFDNVATGDEGHEGSLFGETTLTYSYVLMGIVAFILLMVCVNFLNLTIADSLKRSKEIGVRKISGASRRQIVQRFLAEAAIICGIAFILALLLTWLILPLFNKLAQKDIHFSLQSNPALFVYGAMLLLACIIIAGLYPAIKLSLFNPLEILYNKQKLNGKNYFAKGLIVLQFTLGAGLTIASITYYKQMNFIGGYNLGLNMDNVVEVGLPAQRVNHEIISALRDELAKEPSVNQMAYGEMIPGDGADVKVDTQKIRAAVSHADAFFVPTLSIRLLEGRNFINNFPGDSANAIIVNKIFLQEAGLKNAVGKQIVLTDGMGVERKKVIIGVVADYHYNSLKEKVSPLVLETGKYQAETIWVKIKSGKAPQALAAIQKIYRKIFPGHYFDYAFLSDENAALYAQDERWKQIITFAAFLAIFICCTGLFGLAHFAAQQRVKEIGIRKVLGASVTNITTLLSKDFLRLVILALAIASPMAWYCMNKWLENFAYRTTVGWQVFSIAGFISLFVALFTVGMQAAKAGMANPVESLRTE